MIGVLLTVSCNDINRSVGFYLLRDYCWFMAAVIVCEMRCRRWKNSTEDGVYTMVALCMDLQTWIEKETVGLTNGGDLHYGVLEVYSNKFEVVLGSMLCCDWGFMDLIEIRFN